MQCVLNLSPPAGSPDLDELQREGVASLISKGLDAIDGITGPDDMEVDVEQHWVGVYPTGALVVLFIDAPAIPKP